MELIIYIKMDLALNNLQRLICHKSRETKPNQLLRKYKHFCFYLENCEIKKIQNNKKLF